MSQVTHASSQTTWYDIVKSAPRLFVSTLFEPFTNEDAQAFLQEQQEQIESRGLVSYTWTHLRALSHHVYEHPLETLSLTGTVALGHVPTEREASLLLLSLSVVDLVKTANGIRARSETDPSLVGRVSNRSQFLGLGIVTIGLLSALPKVGALDWASLQELKNLHPDGVNEKNLNDEMLSFEACIDETQSLQQCLNKLPSGTVDAYVLSHHHSGVLSNVKFQNETTCLSIAHQASEAALQVCYNSPTNFTSYTLEPLNISLPQELPSGASFVHIEILLENKKPLSFLKETRPSYDLGSKPICILIKATKSAPSLQLCFNPNDAASMTLEKAPEGIHLMSQKGPVSVIIDNPERFGLNPNQESLECSPEEKRGGFFNLFSWWPW